MFYSNMVDYPIFFLSLVVHLDLAWDIHLPDTQGTWGFYLNYVLLLGLGG